MPELALIIQMTFGDRWETFERKMPPNTTREECMQVAEEVAQFAILLSENKSRVQFGCRQLDRPV